MREIKFRAWDEGTKAYQWPWNPDKEAFWILGETTVFNMLKDRPIERFNDLVIEQYAGLKDRNGREIYEGDILSFAWNITADDSFGIEPNGYIYGPEDVHQVLWNHELVAWDLDFRPDDERKYMRDTRGLFVEGYCEIIGNVHENPELIAKEDQ